MSTVNAFVTDENSRQKAYVLMCLEWL